MNHRPRLVRRPLRAWPLTARAAAAIAAATTLAACGSSSLTAGARTKPNRSEARRDTLDFARCMRSHGVSSFPDDLDFRNVAGINPSAPAFKAAQAACQHLLPVKAPPPAAPSEQTRARLIRLAGCLRARGYPSMPDPRPNPPPAGGSPEADRYSALFGEGDYWIGIPKGVDPHGVPFIHALRACHASP